MRDLMSEYADRIAESRAFLTRLWNLENDERPGFMIGDAGPKVKGGTRVKNAFFSQEGSDTIHDRILDPAKYLQAQIEEHAGYLSMRGDVVLVRNASQ